MRLVILLGIAIFGVSSCVTRQPVSNYLIEVQGKSLPQLSAEGRYKKYFKKPDGKVLAVSKTNGGYYYRHGHCNLPHAIVLTLQNCAKRTGSECKIFAIGNNIVSRLSDNSQSQVALTYQNRIADEHAQLASPSFILNLSALTTTAEPTGLANNVYVGKISADRRTPCAGHVQTELGDLGTCTGVWKNVGVELKNGKSLTRIRIDTTCDHGIRLVGGAALFNTEYGAAVLSSSDGRVYRSLIGNVGAEVTTAKNLRTHWSRILKSPEFKSSLEFLRLIPAKSNPI